MCNNCNNCNNNCGVYSNFVVQKPKVSQTNKSTGDSRAIRIGNDIKLDVTILELAGMEVINIKSIKCFIVNTTPMLRDHCGTAYEIHRCGLPTYHAYPACEYHGFGIYPYFPKNWHYNLRPHYDYYHKYYGHHYLKPICPGHPKPFEFIAPVKALKEQNKVRVFFPATAQLLCGLYSLTFVIQLYEPGYHKNDLRTVTVDYNNVFELVPNAEGRSGDITIDIDKQIGINTYDEYMFGNTTQTSGTQTSQIQVLEINGPSSIRVGQTATFVGSSNPNSNDVEWSLCCPESVASIGLSAGNTAIVTAKGVENVVDGETTATLIFASTDGGNKVATAPIKIHNYATDISFGQYGKTVTLRGGESIAANLYIIQEDGTKISACERLCDCQQLQFQEVSVTQGEDAVAFKFGKNNTDCEWIYDGQQSNMVTDATDEHCSGCGSQVLTLINTNTGSESVTAKIKVVGNAKKADGQPIEKEITIICLGTNGNGSGNGQGGQNQDGDDYVTSGTYQNGRITLNRVKGGTVDVNVESLVPRDPEYWWDYSQNS